VALHRGTDHQQVKIFSFILGYHQEILLNNMRRRWPFGFKGQLEMADYPVDGFWFFDKRDDAAGISLPWQGSTGSGLCGL